VVSRPAASWRSARSQTGTDPARPNDWQGVIRSRLLVCAGVFAVWTVGIEARLIVLQVVQHGELMARAERQQLSTLPQPAKRGEILDREGRVLAYSVDADSICADPSSIADPEAAAAQLCSALEHCDEKERRTVLTRLSSSRSFAYIRRHASPDEVRRVAALKLDGVFFIKETRRYYPNRELAANLLGYVGVDGNGLSGLEFAYDEEIRGRAGRLLIQKDARQRAMESRVDRPATAGAALGLTIDTHLQHIAERELRAAVDEHHAAGGSVVIMAPHSGEILALASWPTFNPNVFGRQPIPQESQRNRAVQDLYEPGSTFKVVTASAALEEDVLAPDAPIDCSPGYITFGSHRISDVHRNGVLPFTDVIVKSSNVGAVKVGLRLGAERLSQYARRFGFGQALSPDFPGESRGIVWDPARLNDSALAWIAIGYQVGVTPLQMAAAVSAVANGGELVQPRVVHAIVRDGSRSAVTRKVLRRVIAADTAAELTTIMEEVVARGTAAAAALEDHQVAAKTGTAQKLVNGRYSKSDYNASIVGFVPSRKPALTIVVVIDSPRRNGYFGGDVAAPVFKRIAEASLQHLEIAPTRNPQPPVLVSRPDEAPRPDVRPARAAAAPQAAMPAADRDLMPDLRGMSAREALRALGRLGAAARMRGSGFVVRHSPPAGARLEPGAACVIELRREAVSPSAGGLR
jgi:cell division protein FtsI (penicillin-binding protein 3)